MEDIPLLPDPRPPKKPSRLPPPAGSAPPEPPRRGFLYQAFTLFIGGLVGIVPLAAGVWTFFSPLLGKKKGAAGKLLRIANLDEVGEEPKAFAVVAEKHDAWTTFAAERIGAVFLRRLPGGNKVQGFSAICPHAGCFVGFKSEAHEFVCPCHTSAFSIDGQRAPDCPSPRDLDPIECVVQTADGKQEVFIKYVEYYPGLAERKAKS